MSFATSKSKDNQTTKSTALMTTSTISSDASVDNQDVYDEEFTLMGKKNKNVCEKKRDDCLAMKIAERFPLKIKIEVVKMIQYYEDALQSQLKDYHRLVAQNKRIKHQKDILEAENISLKLQPQRVIIQQKQIRTPLTPIQPKQMTMIDKTPEKNILRDRVDELEEKVIVKDQKINSLNSQIGQLTLKLRKYRKRAENTGVKGE